MSKESLIIEVELVKASKDPNLSNVFVPGLSGSFYDLIKRGVQSPTNNKEKTNLSYLKNDYSKPFVCLTRDGLLYYFTVYFKGLRGYKFVNEKYNKFITS